MPPRQTLQSRRTRTRHGIICGWTLEAKRLYRRKGTPRILSLLLRTHGCDLGPKSGGRTESVSSLFCLHAEQKGAKSDTSRLPRLLGCLTRVVRFMRRRSETEDHQKRLTVR